MIVACLVSIACCAALLLLFRDDFRIVRDWRARRRAGGYIRLDDVLGPGQTLVLVSATGDELDIDVSLARAAGWTCESILRTLADIDRAGELTA